MGGQDGWSLTSNVTPTQQTSTATPTPMPPQAAPLLLPWKPGIIVMCPDTRQLLSILTGFLITKEWRIFCGQTKDMPPTVSKL